MNEDQYKERFSKELATLIDNPESCDEFSIQDLEDLFSRGPTVVLPIVHKAYKEVDPDRIDFLPYIVLEYLPDFTSIDFLIETEQDVALNKEELMYLPGFKTYYEQNGDPFEGRDMSRFEKSPEEKLLSHSLLPMDNLSEGSVNKEILSNGVTRVQYPKSMWRNQKERKINSFKDDEGKIFRGVKTLWPADMDKIDIQKVLDWARTCGQIDTGPGVRGFGHDRVSLYGILWDDGTYRHWSLKWNQVR